MATATPDTPWTFIPRYGSASVSKLASFTIVTSEHVSKPKRPFWSVFVVDSEMAYAVARTQRRFLWRGGKQRKKIFRKIFTKIRLSFLLRVKIKSMKYF